MPAEPRRFCEERQPLANNGRDLDRALSRHRAEVNRPVAFLDISETVDPIQVDESGGPAQPKVQKRHEALAAGQDLRVSTIPGEQSDGLLDTRRSMVVEFRGLHVRVPRARRIRSQRRVGVIGNSLIRTPIGASASLTALAMTAGTVIELDSPSPFDPSVVNGDGEQTWAMSITGASLPVGT